MKLLIIAILSCLGVTDEYGNYCWDVKLYDETLFCGGDMHWAKHLQVSEEVYYDRFSRDQKAKEDYAKLLVKWKAHGGVSDHPTNDCLAIARDTFCAYRIPTCASRKKPE